MATRRKMKRNDYSRTKIKVLPEGRENPRQPGSFAHSRYDVLLRMSKGGKVQPVASDVFDAKAKKPYRPVDLLKDIAFKRVTLVPMKKTA